MSGVQVVGKVVLPQAVIRMLPALGSIVSVTIKDTAIAATIAVPEYMEQSQTLAGQSFRPIEVFTTAMVVYFVILFPATRAVDMLYRRGCASGPVMSFDWGVVWQYRGALRGGRMMTVLLAVITMLIAIPGGIVLALMRLSPLRLVSAASACFVEFFRNIPLILLVYMGVST